MKTFEHFNQGSVCPICGTNEDKPPVLVGIHDTEKGNICEALQVHLDCLHLTAYREDDKLIIAMAVEEKK